MTNGTTTRWPTLSFAIAVPTSTTSPMNSWPRMSPSFMPGNVVIVEMQVRAADRGRGDADDGVARIDDLRIRHRLDAHVVLALPGQCAHGCSSSRGAANGGSDVGDLAGLHELLEASQIVARLDLRLALEELRDELAERAARADRRQSSPSPPCRGRRAHRETRCGRCSARSAPSADRQRCSSPGISSVITRVPFDGRTRRALTTQCERRSSRTVTLSMFSMNSGRLRKSRQNAYSSWRGRLIVTVRPTSTSSAPRLGQARGRGIRVAWPGQRRVAAAGA